MQLHVLVLALEHSSGIMKEANVNTKQLKDNIYKGKVNERIQSTNNWS